MTDDVHPLPLADGGLPAPVERPLAGGETHTFKLALAAERYLHMSVDQRGIDVVVRLFAPGGDELISADSPTGARGDEVLTAVTPTAGEYRLEIAAYAGEVKPGRYALKVEELRPATAEDRRRVGAALAFQAGEKLRREATADSRRQSIEKYSEALDDWRALEDHHQEAKTLYRIGWMQAELEELDDACDAYRKARQLFHDLGDRRREGVVLNSLGAVELRLEELAAARQAFDDALRIFGEIERPALEASVFFNLGNLHERRNAPQKALDAYRAGLERAHNAEDEGREARARHNIGTILLYQGQVDEALHELRRALELRRKLNDRSDLATTLNRIGDAYQRLGKLDEAFEHLREALELRRADGNPRGLAVGLTSLGNLYLRQGRRSEAAECYEEALTLVREIGRRHDEAVLLINLGRHNEDSGDGAGALALYERAIALFQLSGHPRGEAYARYASARILHDLGAFTAARAHLEDAVVKIEELRPEFEQEGLRMAFFATKQEFYELLIDVLMHLDEQVPEPAAGYDALALEVNERRRARVLLDLLSEARAEVRRGVDPRLLEREAQVQEALNAAQRTVIAARRSSPAAVIAAHETRQCELIRELEEVRRTIRKESPRYAELMQPKPLKTDEIRALLDRDDLMLVYCLGEERSFLWSLSRTGSTSYVLPGRAEIERLAFAAYRHWARVGLRTGDSGEGAVRQLGAALLEAVTGELGSQRLIIVADGALQYLPFAALPDPAAPAVPLVVDHEIVQLPSATVLATLRRAVFNREPAPFDLALIADPVFDREDPRVARGASSSTEISGSERLPGDLQRAADEMGVGHFSRLTGTRREAEAVGALIPEDMRLEAFDFDASRATVLSGELDRFKVLHFATHGLLSPTHPELSGLVLSLVDEAGNPQDGFLRLHEIYNLELPAEFVVLSGCRTGLGAEVAGEGMVGLTRGFMYAGTPRVIVSLWKVDDESTAELMKRFYNGVFKGNLSPAAALRAAQLALLQDERWQDPYHWAPFVFQGEWLLESPKVADIDSKIEPEEGGGQDLDPLDSEIGPPNVRRRPPGGGRDEMARNDVNGVDGATGKYLPPPPSWNDVIAHAGELVLHPAVARERQWVAESRSDDANRLPGYGIDPRELASAGWGVIFAPDVDAGTREALKPLLDHRKAEAGARFGVYEYPPGKSKDDFLADLGVGFGPVDPKQVPYYLLLVGDPRTLPFRFQVELDMQYAVGRLHFDRVDEYGNYAESVVRAETGARRRLRRIAFFATENPDDLATRRMSKHLIEPLTEVLARERPDWEQQLVVGQEATKQRLARLLGGDETPAILFTATHGMGFPRRGTNGVSPYPHERLRSDQGALLCQDWPGPRAWSGPIARDHYYAAGDVPEEADLNGLVVFHFACYSAGTPEHDSYSRAQLGLATLHDGGATDDGEPYFVMEHIEGDPIERYCEDKGLSVPQRLRLFRKVCAAVRFAHRHLVVHRDLKPDNILVTADGEPKLLDFGIAKLLDDSLARSGLTEAGRGPMTRLYASPEQIRGEAVGTTSDVYSLGVVLYQLVTGSLPYRFGTGEELEKAICEQVPEAPGSSQDLDSIVLKALCKEPERRYGSVDELSEDLRRHLDGWPVEAREGNFAYHAGKFFRRHKLVLAASSVILLMVLGFSVLSTLLWRQTVSEREQAVRERQRAEAATDFLKDLFRDVDPDAAGGEELTARELLERGKRRLAESHEPELRIGLAGTLGEIYRNLGAFDDSRELMEEALRLARRHYAEDHPELAKRIANLGVLLYDYGDYRGAESLFREALAIQRRLRMDAPYNFRMMDNLASTLMLQGQFEEAEKLYLEVLHERQSRYRAGDPDVGTSLRSLGALYYARGELEQAEDRLWEALAIRRQVYGDEHTRTASVLDLLGSVMAARGRPDEAKELYDEALAIRRRRLGENHARVAQTKKNLAALDASDDPATAAVLAREALLTFRRSKPGGWESADAESVLGACLTGLGRYAEAEQYLIEGHATLAEIRGEEAIYTRNALDRLLVLYERWNHPEKLDEYRALAER